MGVAGPVVPWNMWVGVDGLRQGRVVDGVGSGEPARGVVLLNPLHHRVHQVEAAVGLAPATVVDRREREQPRELRVDGSPPIRWANVS